MTLPYSHQLIRRHLRLGEDSGWEFEEVEFRGDQPAPRHRDSWPETAWPNASPPETGARLGVRQDERPRDSSEGRRYFMERRGDGVPIIRRETKALTGREPRFRLIDDSELCLTIPAAETDFGPATVTITVHRSQTPLAGADVLALYPNGTWKRGSTDQDGETHLDLPAVHLPMTVFAAAPGCAGHVEREWIPAQRPLGIDLAWHPWLVVGRCCSQKPNL